MSLLGKIGKFSYRIYRKHIYYRIKELPGAHKLFFLTIRLAERDLPKIDEEPQSIFERGDWDNLIILDACRHDIYEEVTGKEVPKRVTLGSTSGEYVKYTFSEGDFSDIVYINTNGYISDLKMAENTGIPNPFETKYMVRNEDGELSHKPEHVVRDVRSAEKLFPDEKKIIHFMQPHEPFLNYNFYERVPEDQEHKIMNNYDLVLYGFVSQEEIIEAYKDNLREVLEQVRELEKSLSGKTIITADHGEYLGENGLYRHPDRSDTEILREVPWDEIS